MIQIRKSSDRGHAQHGWLDSYHTFSFGDYQDRDFMGFRDLRVINEDRVVPGEGFGRHGHKDMEIVSYVLSGALEHKDSLGTGSVLHYGDVQRMSAGTGVMHSEFNHSKSEGVHFLQIWILPEKKSIPASYEETSFTREQKLNKLCLIVSKEGEHNSLHINQNVRIYATILESNKTIQTPLDSKKFYWIQVATGSLEMNGSGKATQTLSAGDGAAVSGEDSMTFQSNSKDSCEFLWFELK